MISLSDRQARDEARRVLRKIGQRERKERKAERPKSQKADRGRVRDPGFLAFLRRQPCAVGPNGCSGPVEAAHIRFASAAHGKPLTGLQVKPSDRFAAPLCVAHHRDGPDAQHRANERAWWSAHGIDALALCERLYAEYLAGG